MENTKKAQVIMNFEGKLSKEEEFLLNEHSVKLEDIDSLWYFIYKEGNWVLGSG